MCELILQWELKWSKESHFRDHLGFLGPILVSNFPGRVFCPLAATSHTYTCTKSNYSA